MDFKEYQSIDAINASFLKACADGEHAGYQFMHGPKKESDAMTFGSAVHSYLLEPDTFNNEWAVSPKFDRRTKLGKDASQAFDLEHSGKRIIDEEQFTLLEKIRRNCNDIASVKNALSLFEKEKTYIWEDGGIKFKARHDLVNEKDGIIIDVKTCKSAEPQEFVRSILQFKYSLQLFHYTRPIKAETKSCFAIAIETDTCEIALYNLDKIVYSDYTINMYKKSIETALKVRELKTCPKKYSDDIISLELPKWVL